jgi:hypothetical protein
MRRGRRYTKTGCHFQLHPCHASFADTDRWPNHPGKTELLSVRNYRNINGSEQPRNCCVTVAMVWDVTPLGWCLWSNPHGVTYQNNVILLHSVLPFIGQQISDFYVCCSLHDSECGVAGLCSLWCVLFCAAHIRHLQGKSLESYF